MGIQNQKVPDAWGIATSSSADPHVLIYNLALDTLALYEGHSVGHYTGVFTHEPLETVVLSDPEAVIQLALTWGIGFSVIMQFIDNNVRDEWIKTGHYDRLIDEMGMMSYEKKKELWEGLRFFR